MQLAENGQCLGFEHIGHLDLLVLVVSVDDRGLPAERQDGVGLGGVGSLVGLVGLLLRWPGGRPGATGLGLLVDGPDAWNARGRRGNRTLRRRRGRARALASARNVGRGMSSEGGASGSTGGMTPLGAWKIPWAWKTGEPTAGCAGEPRVGCAGEPTAGRGVPV